MVTILRSASAAILSSHVIFVGEGVWAGKFVSNKVQSYLVIAQERDHFKKNLCWETYPYSF